VNEEEGWRGIMNRTSITIALIALAAFAYPGDVPEARVTLDVKNVEVRDVVGALMEVAGFQAVFDSGLSCRLTLSVHEMRWSEVLLSALDACAFGYEEEGTVVRIARRSQLTSETAERRRFSELKARNRSRSVELFRLSYARAREMAPIVKGFLSESGEVVYDERTNTLIIIE
jgi:type II secretory pathway component GspD/PulD (secretin)